MGNCNTCFRDPREKAGECSLLASKEDLSGIIKLQGILRGYIDRRKSVEYSKLRYSKRIQKKDSKTLK